VRFLAKGTSNELRSRYEEVRLASFDLEAQYFGVLGIKCVLGIDAVIYTMEQQAVPTSYMVTVHLLVTAGRNRDTCAGHHNDIIVFDLRLKVLD
jgi:hypothetical protein